MKKKYDLIVIGFGKAGKTLAAKLSKAGKSVALIEKDANMYGGTCINVGCIPSKRLITDAHKSPKADFNASSEYYKNTIEDLHQLLEKPIMISLFKPVLMLLTVPQHLRMSAM